MSAAKMVDCPHCAGSGQLPEGLCDDCDSSGQARCVGRRGTNGRHRCEGFGVEGEYSTEEQPLCIDCQSDVSNREREKAVRRVA